MINLHVYYFYKVGRLQLIKSMLNLYRIIIIFHIELEIKYKTLTLCLHTQTSKITCAKKYQLPIKNDCGIFSLSITLKVLIIIQIKFVMFMLMTHTLIALSNYRLGKTAEIN